MSLSLHLCAKRCASPVASPAVEARPPATVLYETSSFGGIRSQISLLC